jgi:hypothetical protein
MRAIRLTYDPDPHERKPPNRRQTQPRNIKPTSVKPSGEQTESQTYVIIYVYTHI